MADAHGPPKAVGQVRLLAGTLALTLEPDGQAAVLVYRDGGATDGTLWIQIELGATGGGYVLPEAAAQETAVGGWPAVYVRGENGDGGRWNAQADAIKLGWRDADLTFVLSASGLGLGPSDVVQIAESLR